MPRTQPRVTKRNRVKADPQNCDTNDTNVSLPCADNVTDEVPDRLPSPASLNNLIPGGHKRVTTQKDIAAYEALSVEKQRDVLRKGWGHVAYVLLDQAKRHAPHLTKKDYGRLMQLVTTAGIAYDKFVPKDMAGSGSVGVILGLFHGMDKQAVGKVLGPVVEAEVVTDGSSEQGE